MLPRFHFSIERWRKNVEYGVWVSNQGRIKLIKNKETLYPRIDQDGYCNVFTELGTISVHRLVAYTWLGGKRNAKYNVDHINSNKRDNSVKNLRWVTREVNLEYAAFTQCKGIKETVPQTSVEADEDSLAILFNTALLDEQRITELKNLLSDNKIEIKCGNEIITTYEQLFKIKNKKANPVADMNQFIIKMLSVANCAKLYCGTLWKIKLI